MRHVQGLPKTHKRGRARPSDVCECSSLRAQWLQSSPGLGERPGGNFLTCFLCPGSPLGRRNEIFVSGIGVCTSNKALVKIEVGKGMGHWVV